jgi:hypothetical protein
VYDGRVVEGTQLQEILFSPHGQSHESVMGHIEELKVDLVISFPLFVANESVSV